MVKKMTPLNKALVQNWTQLAAMDDDEPLVRVLSQRQIAALTAMCEYLKWLTRYDSPPSQDTIDGFSAETEFNLTNPLDLCELLEPCLAPILDKLDSIESSVTNITNIVEALQEAMEAGRAREIQLPAEPAGDAVYAGSLALVQAMDRKNRELYAEAEASSVDNTAEWIGQILDLFPNFSAQGVGAGADMANAYFENQVATYEADYPDFEVPAAFNLYCFIEANDGVLNIDVWGDWLDGIDTVVEDNAPAKVYAKYSPLRQTFLNQIAELLNGEQSLKSYFDELWNVYYTGTQTPVALPSGYVCPEQWCEKLDASNGLLETLFVSAGGGGATWTGTGWGQLTSGNGRITIKADLLQEVDMNGISVILSDAITNGDTDTITLYKGNFDSVLGVQPSAEISAFSFDDTLQVFALDVISDFTGGGPGGIITAEIIEVHLHGYGTPPGIGDPC